MNTINYYFQRYFVNLTFQTLFEESEFNKIVLTDIFLNISFSF